MDFILLDIKNFLKKLENGQLEIAAGQWELHKHLTNMKLAMGELRNLKEDVEKVRLSSVQQMHLIKAVQEKIDLFKQNRLKERPTAVSERSVKYEKVYKRPPIRRSSPKDYKKRKNRLIRSEEILEITSQISNEKSESEQETVSFEAEKRRPTVQFERNLERNSVQSLQRNPSHVVALSRSKANSQYSYFTNNDILQRYLEDSAKYVDRKKSKTTELSGVSSKQNSSETNNKPPSGPEHTPFWDEYGLRDGSNSVYKEQNPAKKENSSETVKEVDLMPKRLVCPSRCRKLTDKASFTKHGRNHRRAKTVLYCKVCSKPRSTRHKVVRQVPSIISTGFKCSYCDKICSTPEKLTSHLRECRIIMRHHFIRK